MNTPETSWQFFTYARDESEYWQAETLADYGIRAVLCVYLICEGEASHLCSITPQSYAVALRNVFIFDPESPNYRPLAGSLDLEFEGLDSTYLGFIDHAKQDSRFVSDLFTVTADDLPNMGAEIAGGMSEDEANRRGAWDTAQEREGQNPTDPAITADSEFDAWQAEQRAARIAENRKPLAGQNALPLFVAASNVLRLDYHGAKAIGWI
jgi:hypothetical protein